MVENSAVLFLYREMGLGYNKLMAIRGSCGIYGGRKKFRKGEDSI